MNKAAEKITRLIEERGKIGFETFMHEALYCPVYGFYEREADTIGRHGHYFSNVSVGPVFGHLLAWQFAEWLERIREGGFSGPLHLVEAGAHDGKLAEDILSWLHERRPSVASSVTYLILEPSQARRTWQQARLAKWQGQIRWVENFSKLESITGIIFCNELLDALPARRFGWDATVKRWFEWGVGLKEGKFVWTRLEPAPMEPALLADGLASISKILPDGFTTEICPMAMSWWQSAAKALTRGKLLTFDYGYTADELCLKTGGTLRAYNRHHLAADILEAPGEQDITAGVNYSALQAGGEKVGLVTETFSSQSAFLTRIFERAFAAGDAEQSWLLENRRQFQTLVHPEHLGASFRTLVQARA